jgi:hypothetical protein
MDWLTWTVAKAGPPCITVLMRRRGGQADCYCVRLRNLRTIGRIAGHGQGLTFRLAPPFFVPEGFDRRCYGLIG